MNHLDRSDLRKHLDPHRSATTKTTIVTVESLAEATELPALGLLHALPDLRRQAGLTNATPFRGRTLPLAPNSIRPACRRCIAVKNIRWPVRVWMRHDHNVCLQHGLWIGPGPATIEDQREVSEEIRAAQQRHNRLIRRYGRRAVHDAFTTARRTSNSWEQRGDCPSGRRRRHREVSGRPPSSAIVDYQLIQYPGIIALTSIFLSPHYQHLANGGHLGQFHTQVRQSAIPDLQVCLTRDLMTWTQRHHEFKIKVRAPGAVAFLQPFETAGPQRSLP